MSIKSAFLYQTPILRLLKGEENKEIDNKLGTTSIETIWVKTTDMVYFYIKKSNGYTIKIV